MLMPKTLNVLHAGVCVTEVEIDYDLTSGNYDIVIPKKTLVEKVLVATDTKFEGVTSLALVVGDSTDADGFLANADLTPGTAGAVGNSATVSTPNAFQEGKYYPSGGTFRLGFTKASDGTAGKYRVFIYSRTSQAANNV